MRFLLRVGSGHRDPTVYCGLSAASPQKDRELSTFANANDCYKASSAPCFIGSQRLPINAWVVLGQQPD